MRSNIYRNGIFALAFGALVVGTGTGPSVAGTGYEIDQLTDVSALAPEDLYRFHPNFLWIEPGDTVRFMNSIGNHTIKSIPGIWPEGVEMVDIAHKPAYDVTLTVPGVYGFKCKVHNRHGMFALVVVDTPDPNLEKAKQARVNDRARVVFDSLFKKLDEVKKSATMTDSPHLGVIRSVTMFKRPWKLVTILPLALILIAAPAGAGELADRQPTTDFTKAEPREAHQGGDATHFKAANRNAFSLSSANMSFEKELDFKVGNGFFRRIWVSAPASTKAADGLGPLFNAKACQRCHIKDGRGHPPAANWPDDDAVSMFLRLSIPPETAEQKRLLAERRINVVPEPTYGGQLQDLAIQGHEIEGRMHIAYTDVPVELADGTVVTLRRPTYSVTDLGYGPLHPKTMLSPRVAPPMIGLGLLEQIPADDICANADPKDADGDGISGRAQVVWDPEKNATALGRFGWKAGNATVNAQNQGAFSGDIGISTPLNPDPAGECTPAETACREPARGRSAV